MISCLSGRPCLFPGLPQLCCTSSLRVSSWQSIPDLSLGCNPTPQAWAWAPSPHSSWTWKPFLGWKVLFDNDLSGEFSPFCLPSTCCCVPLWGFIVPPPTLPVRGVLSVWKPVLLQDPLPRVKVSIAKSFVYFLFLYLLPWLILRWLASLFGSLASSASVQKVFHRSIFVDICGFEGDLPILVLCHLIILYITFKI